ncbi:hypothetical protein [Kitasatospora cheerisanensis]|uniref:Uncharacterized protein n=1 Tax=Kitasatospora cheerisanensis KCTC 2395 TaxID=1348663 RepID=A0A066YMN7_9ACTN|nr:hypothetical protein [Kitasatospora cheerisanensis]KDN82427.1 hypothetical protein KCH_59340 [Kitasatospora cheerisanensis KCTC 2395]
MSPDERAAQARRARFGALPERVALADTVEERPPADRPVAAYDPDGASARFSCLAADLGL